MDVTPIFAKIESGAFAAHQSHNGEYFAYNIHGFLQLRTDGPFDPKAQAVYDYFYQSDADLLKMTGTHLISEWVILHYEQIDGKARAGEIVHQSFNTLEQMGEAWHAVLVTGELPADELEYSEPNTDNEAPLCERCGDPICLGTC